jgi:hypothetical protein
LTADDLKAFFDHGATRMGTDKEELGCTRRASGAKKKQTSIVADLRLPVNLFFPSELIL